MTAWRALTDRDEDYCRQGLAVLAQILPGREIIEAPELQALYDWCLEQTWEGGTEALEEYGPVLALGLGLGAEIVRRTGMDWVWVERDPFEWFGLALKSPGADVFLYPTRMVAQRLSERSALRIEPLIEAASAAAIKAAREAQAGPAEAGLREAESGT